MAFRYESSQDPRVTGTIADLMLRRGDIAAHATAANGAIWSGAAQNVGQMIGAIPAQLMVAKRAQLQDQIGEQQLQDMRANATDRTMLHADQEAARHNALTSQIGLALHDRLRPDDPTNNLQAMQEALDAAEHHQLITSDQAQQFGALASADPSKIPEVAKSWAGMTPQGRAEIEKTITSKPGETVTSRWDNTPVGTPVPEKKKYQSKTALLDGEPRELSFDEGTGHYLYNGEDVTGRVQPVPKEQAPKAYQHVDKLLDGKPATLLLDPAPGGKLYDLSGKEIDNAASRVKPIPPASTTVNVGQQNDVKETIQGMKEGTIPPQMPGRASKDYTAIMAEAHRQGYDLAAAVGDWNATQKHLATMNGAKFTALRSSIDTAYDSLDVIDELAKKWDAGRFPVLSKANLILAKSGVLGKDAASIASQLEGQITDVTSELGNVYMGGNSPTDHALKLAEKNLSASWDKKVLLDMTQLARTNLQIRKNSITHSAPAGLSTDQTPAAPPPAAPSAVIYAKDAQGMVHSAKAGTALPAGWIQVQR